MATEGGISRRTLMVGAAGFVAAGAGLFELVDQGVLPGQHRLHALLGEDGPAGVIPDVATGRIEDGETDGVRWALCHPPSPQGQPRLIVALAGRGDTVGGSLQNIGLARYLAASHLNVAILVVEGGSSYYHRRRDGSDVGAVVLDQLIPLARTRSVDVTRPAFFGWSMGGYGALLLAAQRRHRKLPVAAVAVSSAALWSVAGDSAAGAFDDAEDFNRNNVFDKIGQLRGVPLRVDCGLDDPFYAADKRFASLSSAEANFSSGAHNAAFWSRVFPSQLAWMDRHLAH